MKTQRKGLLLLALCSIASMGLAQPRYDFTGCSSRPAKPEPSSRIVALSFVRPDADHVQPLSERD